MPAERRRHKRYPVDGDATFLAASLMANGDLLDVAKGGALIHGAVVPSDGSWIAVHFVVSGYPWKFEAKGKVVRDHPYRIAIMFLDEPAGLEELLRWLERTYGPVKVE